MTWWAWAVRIGASALADSLVGVLHRSWLVVTGAALSTVGTGAVTWSLSGSTPSDEHT
jgi:hypothetical protein